MCKVTVSTLLQALPPVGVNACGHMVCIQHRWEPLSADISQAFLRGLTFEENKAMDGEIEGEVQITVPPGSVPVLRQISGYEDFNLVTEVLELLRGGLGLKDAA